MATNQIKNVITLEAGANLSAGRYKFIKVASDGQIDLATLDATADGVLLDDPFAAGQSAMVGTAGISKVVAGAAVTRGGDVVSDASGRAINKGANNNVLGVALDTASAAGEIIRILLKL